MKKHPRFKIAGGNGHWIAWDEHFTMRKWERYAATHLASFGYGWVEIVGCKGRSPAEALHRIKMRTKREGQQ